MVIAEAVMDLGAAPAIASAAVDVASIFAAILLFAGLWTPVSGSLIAAAGLWTSFTARAELSTSVLLTAVCVALVMLGPGAWSADARLYGWRRIDVHDPRSDRL